MQSAPTVGERSTRRETLLRTLRHRGQRSAALLRLHPNGHELSEALTADRATDVGKMLWDDLAAQYEALPAATRHRDPIEKLPARLEGLKWLCTSTRQKIATVVPTAYWMRRHFLMRRHERQRRAESLPPFPKQLVQMEFLQFSALCRSLGWEMAAYAATVETPENLVRWLSPLGMNAARSVAERLAGLRQNTPLPEIRNRWHAEYNRYLRLYRGTQLASVLGLSLAASIYHRLGERERELVDALADAAVQEALERTTIEQVYSDDSLADVELVLNRALEACLAEQSGGSAA